MAICAELTSSVNVILVTVGEAKGADPPSALIPVKTKHTNQGTALSHTHTPTPNANDKMGHLHTLV